MSKSRRLATISHEIRTPLNGIMGMLQLMQDGELNEEQRERVDIAYQSSMHLMCMINRILDHAKLKSGPAPMVHQVFSLKELLQQLHKLSTGYLTEKNIQLSIHLHDDIPSTLWGDDLRLNQVLTNLVGNAIKFTQEGIVRVSVSLNAAYENDGNQVSLLWTIEDTGIGIPSDKLDVIFESYAQADKSIAGEYGGTGLGLAICKQIVEEMDGRIWVESQVGNGSTFSFTCTMCRVPEEQHNHQDQ